jgi:hypothetical protein
MPRSRINGCAHGSRIAWLVMPRFESMAARMAAACRLAHGASLESVAACNAASLGTGCLASEPMAAHMVAGLRGSRCLASNQWLHAWRQHVAWHMVPSSNQLLHAMQHGLALDASHQNQWLRTWQQDCVARDVSLRIDGCAHGGSIAWHMVPSSNRLLHAMQHRLARDASLQNQWLRTWQQDCLAFDASLRINGCTHGGSIAWHMVPCSNQILHAMQHRLARDALLQNQWLRTWQQDSVARDASLRIHGCMHGGSIAWHMVPRSNQLLHARQHRLALDASLQNQ